MTQAANVIRVLPPPHLLQRTGPSVVAVVLFMTAVAALARFGARRAASPPAEAAEPVAR